MVRPKQKRDITDKHLRRIARAFGYKGKNLPMTIADVLTHPNRPGEDTLLWIEGSETRDEAGDRLRTWAWGRQ